MNELQAEKKRQKILKELKDLYIDWLKNYRFPSDRKLSEKYKEKRKKRSFRKRREAETVNLARLITSDIFLRYRAGKRNFAVKRCTESLQKGRRGIKKRKVTKATLAKREDAVEIFASYALTYFGSFCVKFSHF